VITVSDTTAITTLLKVDRVDLLAQLFGRVLIPSAVERELKHHHGFIPVCCEPHQLAPSERLNRLLAQADPGEAEAICLAVEKRANSLLIDDKKGRRLQNLKVCGVWGCQRSSSLRNSSD
jgi:predicted nucleic acid-binding protein